MSNPAVLDFTLNDSTPDYLEKSYAANLVRYAPNGMAPIFALTTMMNSGMAKSIEHGYFSKTMIFPQTTVTGAQSDSATNVVVADTSQFVAGDMLMNWATNEVLRVRAIVDATNLTVSRGHNTGGSGSAMADGESLYSIGNAFEQGSYRPKSRLLAVSRVINNTQIFRNSWALAHSLAVIKTIVGEGNIAESKKDCGMFHASDIERTILWGQKTQSMEDGQYFTTMNGIWNSLREQVPGNVQAAGATTNYTQLSALLDVGFDTITDGRSGNERVVFVGGGARTVLNDIGRKNGTYQIMDGQTNFGLQYSTFKTARGTFRMIEHPMLNTNADWAKTLFSVDLPSIKPMYLHDRKTQNREYNMSGSPVDDGIDAVGGTLTTELTLEITNPSANVVVTGLTAGTADA